MTYSQRVYKENVKMITSAVKAVFPQVTFEESDFGNYYVSLTMSIPDYNSEFSQTASKWYFLGLCYSK